MKRTLSPAQLYLAADELAGKRMDRKRGPGAWADLGQSARDNNPVAVCLFAEALAQANQDITDVLAVLDELDAGT